MASKDRRRPVLSISLEPVAIEMLDKIVEIDGLRSRCVAIELLIRKYYRDEVMARLPFPKTAKRLRCAQK